MGLLVGSSSPSFSSFSSLGLFLLDHSPKLSELFLLLHSLSKEGLQLVLDLCHLPGMADIVPILISIQEGHSLWNSSSSLTGPLAVLIE